MMTDLDSALARCLARIERDSPPKLVGAIRHAVFPGGARIRPRLCLAVAGADVNDAPALVLAAACSLEMLHCASLVHDDLPCFDDADTRRGLPSVHRAFGEPLAVLAGNALIVLAFETLAQAAAAAPSRLAPLVGLLAQGAGTPWGLVAGQAWESEPNVPVDRYHRAKTGSLFVASAMAGALAAGRDPAPWRTMGECLGQAYQIADDLLDAHPGASDKPTQRDQALGRPSAVAELGIDGAIEKLRGLVAEAAASVPDCPGAGPLRDLVVRMAERLVPASLRRTAA